MASQGLRCLLVELVISINTAMNAVIADIFSKATTKQYIDLH